MVGGAGGPNTFAIISYDQLLLIRDGWELILRLYARPADGRFY